MSHEHCDRHDRYRLLAFEHASEMQAEVNRLMALNVGWEPMGDLAFFNGGYRREIIRLPDQRNWLLPRQSAPIARGEHG